MHLAALATGRFGLRHAQGLMQAPHDNISSYSLGTAIISIITNHHCNVMLFLVILYDHHCEWWMVVSIHCQYWPWSNIDESSSPSSTTIKHLLSTIKPWSTSVRHQSLMTGLREHILLPSERIKPKWSIASIGWWSHVERAWFARNHGMLISPVDYGFPPRSQ